MFIIVGNFNQHQVLLDMSIVVVVTWGRYHQEQSSQLITLKSQIFPDKNANLRSSGLVSLVSKFQSSNWAIFAGNFCNLLSSHLGFRVSFNLLSSLRLIFRLPKNPDTPPYLRNSFPQNLNAK